MATNGESARQWLANNRHSVSAARLAQIRTSLEKKAEALGHTLGSGSDLDADADLDTQHHDVLEALDVIDAFLQTHFSAASDDPTRENDLNTTLTPSASPAPEPPTPKPQATPPSLDTASLASDTTREVPILSPQEKQARFQALLKDSPAH